MPLTGRPRIGTAELYGSNEFEEIRADMVVEGVRDAIEKLRAASNAPADQKAEAVAKFKAEVLPQWLGYFEKLLAENASGPYFLGNHFSLADIYFLRLADLLETIDAQAVLDAFPKVKANVEHTRERPNIKPYLASRPVTAF